MTQPVLFDTHAHLGHLQHRSADEAYTRAVEAGVLYLNNVATDPGNWESVRVIAHRLKNVTYTLGLHPHDAKDWPTQSAQLRSLLATHGKDGKCVGVGETGLDYFYNHSDRGQQIENLEGHIALSKEFELPLILHCRDAFVDLYASLRKVGTAPRPGIMHCFTGNYPQAKEALDLGLYISFSGIVTFKNAEELRQVAKQIPRDRILIETDCPFLTPLPHRGVPNEPYYLPFTAKLLSGLLGMTPEAFGELTTENAKRALL